PTVHRSYFGGTEVADESQVLKVVGETVNGVRMIVQDQHVPDFQNAVVTAADKVVYERIVHPLADLVRQSGRVLRKYARALITPRADAMGLATRLPAFRAVIAADAAAARSHVSVVHEEYREGVWRDLRRELREPALHRVIDMVDVDQ